MPKRLKPLKTRRELEKALWKRGPGKVCKSKHAIGIYRLIFNSIALALVQGRGFEFPGFGTMKVQTHALGGNLKWRLKAPAAPWLHRRVKWKAGVWWGR